MNDDIGTYEGIPAIERASEVPGIAFWMHSKKGERTDIWVHPNARSLFREAERGEIRLNAHTNCSHVIGWIGADGKERMGWRR